MWKRRRGGGRSTTPFQVSYVTRNVFIMLSILYNAYAILEETVNIYSIYTLIDLDHYYKHFWSLNLLLHLELLSTLFLIHLGPKCVHVHFFCKCLPNEISSRLLALLVKCLIFHMLCCPTDRTSIRAEKGRKHLWPVPFSKHPLDLCRAVAGLVSPHCPTWPLHSVQWPCTHKYTHPSTHMQTYWRHAVQPLEKKRPCTQFQPIHASPSSVHLTNNK